jgi:hypothetical protein
LRNVDITWHYIAGYPRYDEAKQESRRGKREVQAIVQSLNDTKKKLEA